MISFHTAPQPLRSVLVANRGEIAARIIDTCKRLGLRSIAIYSEADRNSPHVHQADEAHCVGPAPARDSYLDIDAIIEAARISGADAIHPGYGFLSENHEFVRACNEAGFIFVGPDAEVIEQMGSKIEAKKIARDLGVPTVPGFDCGNSLEAEIVSQAEAIGFPVLIKASAGGGGRGMRRVDGPSEMAASLVSAAQEAKSAFGDGTLLVEKLVEAPRHVEVQIFGDRDGNVVHLFDRDCSVQRNNQKILEEAPAPNLEPEIHDKLQVYALKLAEGIGYVSAGTVEFVLGANEAEPFFLEMNTRLQVEHPVTEAICGVDLVEWQLLVAAGLPLPLQQENIRASGHAIEARIAAERPASGFFPSTGTVLAVEAPAGVRFDAGIAAGSEIGTHYDSMIGKLIAYGSDREKALAELSRALKELAILGVETNQRFLADVATTEQFARGKATTDFLALNFADGWEPDPELLLRVRALAALAWCQREQTLPHLRQDGFRVTRRPAAMSFRTSDSYGSAELAIRIGPSGVEAEADGIRIALCNTPDSAANLIKRMQIRYRLDGDIVHVSEDGLALSVIVARAPRAHVQDEADKAAAGSLVAPLPGLITGILASEGDEVSAGDVVVTMEAMKLVHSLVAPFDGVVSKVHHSVGEVVNAKAIVLEMEES